MSHSLADIANLTTLYSQAHRHYHNLNHINWCLGELEIFAWDNLSFSKLDKRILEYAIWWHDAIYNPYSHENEKESAALFRGEVDSNQHEAGFAERIERIILATGRHTIDQYFGDLSKEEEFLTQLMLDIDLAALGYDWKVYRTNGENIRKEYAHVPTRVFLKNREKLLRAMLNREHIYYTEYFSLKYEDRARANMNRDLQKTVNKLQSLKVDVE